LLLNVADDFRRFPLGFGVEAQFLSRWTPERLDSGFGTFFGFFLGRLLLSLRWFLPCKVNDFGVVGWGRGVCGLGSGFANSRSR
jgi:hypothetical protein